uniref:Uncharacterized protein n=1 Tax=Oryza rufipogon TaxID=4529 RepID=A0A0E0Q1N3_ORYRU
MAVVQRSSQSSALPAAAPAWRSPSSLWKHLAAAGDGEVETVVELLARPGDGASGAGRGRRGVGHIEAKNRAVDGLLEALNKDEKSVLSVLGRANVAALVQLLTAPATKVREKAATVICQFAESSGCEGLLVGRAARMRGEPPAAASRLTFWEPSSPPP